MVGDSLGQPPRIHDDDLFESPFSHRTSIQNSPGWPSVKSLSPYSSIRTLNGPDDEEDRDILSLANFSHADSDRSSMLTVRTLTSLVNSHPGTPRAREHMHSNSLKQGVHSSGGTNYSTGGHSVQPRSNFPLPGGHPIANESSSRPTLPPAILPSAHIHQRPHPNPHQLTTSIHQQSSTAPRPPSTAFALPQPTRRSQLSQSPRPGLPEIVTSVQELRPTFSPAITRTPNHYPHLVPSPRVASWDETTGRNSTVVSALANSIPRAHEHMDSKSLEQGVHAHEFGHSHSHSHSHRYTCSPAQACITQCTGSGSSRARRQGVPGK